MWLKVFRGRTIRSTSVEVQPAGLQQFLYAGDGQTLSGGFDYPAAGLPANPEISSARKGRSEFKEPPGAICPHYTRISPQRNPQHQRGKDDCPDSYCKLTSLLKNQQSLFHSDYWTMPFTALGGLPVASVHRLRTDRPPFVGRTCNSGSKLLDRMIPDLCSNHGMRLVVIHRHRGVSKYPPAKPGALGCEPLKAVGRVADAARELGAA